MKIISDGNININEAIGNIQGFLQEVSKEYPETDQFEIEIALKDRATDRRAEADRKVYVVCGEGVVDQEEYLKGKGIQAYPEILDWYIEKEYPAVIQDLKERLEEKDEQLPEMVKKGGEVFENWLNEFKKIQSSVSMYEQILYNLKVVRRNIDQPHGWQRWFSRVIRKNYTSGPGIVYAFEYEGEKSAVVAHGSQVYTRKYEEGQEFESCDYLDVEAVSKYIENTKRYGN